MPRKPKPTPLKVLAGTRSDRVNASEPKPAAIRPVRPGSLKGKALAEWERLVPVLERMGVLTEADGAALEVYCGAFARKHKAEAALEKYGVVIETDLGGVKANPALAAIKACDDTILRVLASFGLDPSSRSKVTVKAEGPKDELADFAAKWKA